VYIYVYVSPVLGQPHDFWMLWIPAAAKKMVLYHTENACCFWYACHIIEVEESVRRIPIMKTSSRYTADLRSHTCMLACWAGWGTVA